MKANVVRAEDVEILTRCAGVPLPQAVMISERGRAHYLAVSSAPLREHDIRVFARKSQIAAHFSSNHSRSAPSNSSARTSATRA